MVPKEKLKGHIEERVTFKGILEVDVILASFTIDTHGQCSTT
jgi:succinate dehydrogenase flavin-adding protein (antitoxin of CptAB toxin-antitoxin module)